MDIYHYLLLPIYYQPQRFSTILTPNFHHHYLVRLYINNIRWSYSFSYLSKCPFYTFFLNNDTTHIFPPPLSYFLLLITPFFLLFLNFSRHYLHYPYPGSIKIET